MKQDENSAFSVNIDHWSSWLTTHWPMVIGSLSIISQCLDHFDTKHMSFTAPSVGHTRSPTYNFSSKNKKFLRSWPTCVEANMALDFKTANFSAKTSPSLCHRVLRGGTLVCDNLWSQLCHTHVEYNYQHGQDLCMSHGCMMRGNCFSYMFMVLMCVALVVVTAEAEEVCPVCQSVGCGGWRERVTITTGPS